MKKILFTLLFVLTLFSCYKVDVPTLEKDVRNSIVEELRNDPDCAGIHVGDVSLVHLEGKKYVGFVELTYYGETIDQKLEVVVDGDEYIWEIK